MRTISSSGLSVLTRRYYKIWQCFLYLLVFCFPIWKQISIYRSLCLSLFFYFPNNISVLNVTRLFNILSAFFEEFSPPLVLPSFLQPLLISSWSRPNMRRRRTQCRVTRGVHRIKIRAPRSDKRSLSLLLLLMMKTQRNACNTVRLRKHCNEHDDIWVR